MTGAPLAIASRTGRPNPSYSDGMMYTDAALYSAGRSSFRTLPSGTSIGARACAQFARARIARILAARDSQRPVDAGPRPGRCQPAQVLVRLVGSHEQTEPLRQTELAANRSISAAGRARELRAYPLVNDRDLLPRQPEVLQVLGGGPETAMIRRAARAASRCVKR